jgi:hypothetical protein
MKLGPKLVSYKHDNNLRVCAWKHPKGWTQEEVDICIKYYELQAKKLGMTISHYMNEFQWN